MTAKKFTVAEVKDFCQSLGLSFRKVTGSDEYRVAPLPSKPGASTEEQAYYSADLEDIAGTAYEMARR